MDETSQSPIRQSLAALFNTALNHRGLLFSVILIVALAGFEMFNFSTTQYALTDLLGDVRFSGMRWATILALAFCGIDFAGIARLFTPEAERATSREAWYLFAAWLLAATMNAILTWWGVSMALASHTVNSTYIVDPAILSRGVPVFVAAVVWVTRFLLISMLSSAGFGQPAARPQPARRPRPQTAAPQPQPTPALRPSSMPVSAAARPSARAASLTPRSEPRPARTDPMPQRMAPPARQPRPAMDAPGASPAPVRRAAPSETPLYPRPVTDTPHEPSPQSTPAPQRPAVSRPYRPAAPAATPQNKPAAPRPVAKPRPAARPSPQPPQPEEPNLPEPEYIPDPFYSQTSAVYHSLSARADTPPNGSHSKNVF